MIREQQLSAVLTQFARTLVSDYPLQAILDQLTDRIVDVLPISAAGVTLLSPGHGPHLVAASNDAALRFVRLQTTTGEGPCVTAYLTGEAVTVADLRFGDDRFPQFCAEAAEAGIAAVFSFPLPNGGGRLGALDLYRDTPGALDAADLAAAQTLADVTAAYLLNAQARQDTNEAAKTLRASALHDALTGLPNRVLLQERLEHAAERARRSRKAAAVLFVDLDHFKEVNDTYGHPIGDALLVAVARRMGELVRPGDTLSRPSGDEFVLLCEDLDSPDDITMLAERLQQAFSAPFSLSLHDPADRAAVRSTSLELSITASIGMAFARGAEDIGQHLVRAADTAMYQAKRKGGGVHQMLDLREAEAAADRDRLQTDLRRAFQEELLTVAYQPIVATSDGRVTAVEALLRWTDPQRGAVPPALLVAVAEQSSLIVDIGLWVLERACRDHAVWVQNHPHRSMYLAVNVSVRQLMSVGYVASVAAVLDLTGMNPAALVLEMTEGIFFDGPRALTVLAALKSLGVRLALDDFGTGFSSLSYLRRFPVDMIKIDQEFVADVGLEPAGVKILSAVTHLAHALDMTVIAEGIETAAQRDELTMIGCELAQGFFYSPAITAPSLDALLRSADHTPMRLPQAKRA